MNQLPADKNLDTRLLMACFNNTSATYKFYWLLSIMDALEARINETGTLISKRELFARMVSNAWYTVNYFHVSFGKQDKLQAAIERIKQVENITIDAKKHDILNKLLDSKNSETINILNQFNNQVPHWFLSPWFPRSDRSQIYVKSNESSFFAPYALQQQFISVHLLWANYFLENAALIKDFCYWNLLMFLQAKNPNVPDIGNKLIKPAVRNSLVEQRKFWNIVIEELGSVECIYKKRTLTKGDYAVEHFVPYSFVSHDLIWNLIPADPNFNSTKSDKLPPMDKYFNPFFDLQMKAVSIVKEKKPDNKLLEDYLTILPDLSILDLSDAKEKFRNNIQPLITIAANNRFEFLKL